MKTRAANRTYDVFLVKNRRGEWEHRTYLVRRNRRVEPLPKTLEVKFVCRVRNCMYRIDAERAAITEAFGD